MSLMRLLAATHSIVNVREGRSPYEMKQEHLLPQFGPLLRASSTIVPLPAATGGAGGKETEGNKGMSTAAVEIPLDASRAVAAPAVSFPQGRWTFSRRSAVPEPMARATGSGPVQGELALDLVRVVRNDLSEEPARKPDTRARPVEKPKEKTETTGFLWSRITARLFGPGRAAR
jgi:hypothetical protein